MTPADFSAWLQHMGWSDLEASRRLGCGRNTVRIWRRNGAPLYIALAATTLALGEGPWTKQWSPDDIKPT